ncbi:MAG: hypothetical protein ACYDGY_01515 [Acidimicrobiales bacterium]
MGILTLAELADEDGSIDWVILDVLEGAKLAILALKSIRVEGNGAAAFIEEQIRRIETTLGELYEAVEADAQRFPFTQRPYEVPLAHYAT